MIFSWKPEKWPYPRRFAGTARQYSSSAINHETMTAFQMGQSWPYFRCPYQANVMKTFDKTSSRMVLIQSIPHSLSVHQPPNAVPHYSGPEDQINMSELKWFGDYQNEIYFGGLRGVLPKLPVDMASLEKKAMEAWPESIVSYVQGGCGDERTQDLNVTAFGRWGLIPRMMVNSRRRDL